jgi:IMP dehydrogenase
LIEAGADAVKVGIGPGSICTTRIVAGVGVPQVTAIMEAVKACRKADKCLIADGGIKFSGDIVKAIAAGADCVMIGSLFAGTEESPGETILYQGAPTKSTGAWAPSTPCARAAATAISRKNPPSSCPKALWAGCPTRAGHRIHLPACRRSAFRHGLLGCGTVKALQTKSPFMRISPAGLRESHVHDVIITKEAPNYG